MQMHEAAKRILDCDGLCSGVNCKDCPIYDHSAEQTCSKGGNIRRAKEFLDTLDSLKNRYVWTNHPILEDTYYDIQEGGGGDPNTPRPTTTIYIAGPMTGYYAFNFKAFFEAQLALEALGWNVVNPAEEDAEVLRTSGDKGNWETCLQRDEKLIEDKCHAIFFMEGWNESKGALRELSCGARLGLRLFFYENGYPEPKQMEG